MAILKNRLKQNYTQIPNEIITSGLSDKAFRLLVYLYSKPNDWKIYQNQIAKELNVSRSTINRAFKELQEEGYVEINKISVGGSFDYSYEIFIEPRISKCTKSQKCEVAKMRRRKIDTYNNTNYNKDLLNTKTNNNTNNGGVYNTNSNIEPKAEERTTTPQANNNAVQDKNKPSEQQINFAKDLGIEISNQDKHTLSEEIEQANDKRRQGRILKQAQGNYVEPEWEPIALDEEDVISAKELEQILNE